MDPATRAPEGDRVDLDYRVLLTRCLGERSIVDSVLAAFETELSTRLQAVREAAAARDAAALTAAAHTIKGAAANVAAERVRAAAEALEQIGREGSLEGTARGVAEFAEAVQRCRDAVRRARGPGPVPDAAASAE